MSVIQPTQEEKIRNQEEGVVGQREIVKLRRTNLIAVKNAYIEAKEKLARMKARLVELRNEPGGGVHNVDKGRIRRLKNPSL